MHSDSWTEGPLRCCNALLAVADNVHMITAGSHVQMLACTHMCLGWSRKGSAWRSPA
jgi:hypothetical protein